MSTAPTHGRWSVLTDLIFWSVAGLGAVAASSTLATLWGTQRSFVLAIFGAVAIMAVVALRLLWPLHPMSPGIPLGFGLGNLALTPLVFAAAQLHWLPVSAVGDTTLLLISLITAILGLWQTVSAVTARRRA